MLANQDRFYTPMDLYMVDQYLFEQEPESQEDLLQYREDFNRDGRVNIVDVIRLLLYQRDHPGDPGGDYNGDGSANLIDVIALALAVRDLTKLIEVIQGITMARIPSGTFQMGSDWQYDRDNPQKGVFLFELPIHQVTLDAFQMSRTEITQAQYQAVMGNNPSFYTGDTLRPV